MGLLRSAELGMCLSFCRICAAGKGSDKEEAVGKGCSSSLLPEPFPAASPLREPFPAVYSYTLQQQVWMQLPFTAVCSYTCTACTLHAAVSVDRAFNCQLFGAGTVSHPEFVP